MPREAPRFWYEVRPGGWSRLAMTLLAPVSVLWGAVAIARDRRAKPYRSRLPVICVGNFTAGGTGKTPLALEIARRLIAAGERPAFLTRGYGGREPGPHRVDAEVDRAEHVGDEPLLLAARATTVVARDRAAGARLIEAMDATVIVMDDGLLNPGLAKDLSFGVIDGARGLGNGLIMPAGPLRAPMAFQLGLVDAVVVSRDVAVGSAPVLIPTVNEATPAGFTGPVLTALRRPGIVPEIAGKAFVAYAGIGRPAGFFASAERAGAVLTERVAFADHHAFTAADAARLLARADATGAGLLTTEKDLARLARGPDGTAPLEQLRRRSVALPLIVELSNDDGARLDALLAAAVKKGSRE